MARRRLEGLERVLGVNALFSTAYGNVGSSIYYALGLVASYALGLTPLVFVITGFFFLCTAATYAEATTMYPEAGGSSSFARRAFNEFWSFFAAWAQMLTYVVTVAISAFFVPHYLGGLFWEELRHSPGDIIVDAASSIAILARDQRRRRQGVHRRERAAGGRGLPHAGAAGDRRRVLVLGAEPGVSWSTTSTSASRRRGRTSSIAIPIGMLAYTGIETISNMSEEAKDEATTIPAAITRVRDGGVRDLLHAAGGRARRAAGRPGRERRVRDAARPARGGGRLRGRPGRWAWCARLDLGPLQTPIEFYVGLLAATILFLATNAGLIGVSRLVYSMGIHRQLPDALRRLHPKYRTPWIGIIVFSGFAILVTLPGQAVFLGSVYSFGALLSFTMAHLARGPAADDQAGLPAPLQGRRGT